MSNPFVVVVCPLKEFRARGESASARTWRKLKIRLGLHRGHDVYRGVFEETYNDPKALERCRQNLAGVFDAHFEAVKQWKDHPDYPIDIIDEVVELWITNFMTELARLYLFPRKGSLFRPAIDQIAEKFHDGAFEYQGFELEDAEKDRERSCRYTRDTVAV